MLSKRAEKLLQELEDSGQAEALAVADCLRGIADSGSDHNEDLASAAQELSLWYTGTIPCTGEYRCILCGEVRDESATRAARASVAPEAPESPEGQRR